MRIRFARPEDSSALLNIYAQSISTPVTFEYHLPTAQAFAQRIIKTQEHHPFLVWEEDERILGYAYAHPERTTSAYQWNAELTIYLDKNATGQGIGKRLYGALLELLRLQGFRTVYGVVTSPNPASEGLHASLGFNLLGIHHCTGYKNGRWHDVLWYEKALAAYDQDPAPVIPIQQLDQTMVRSTLERYSN